MNEPQANSFHDLPESFKILVDEYLDGTLNESQIEELQTHLRDNATARAYWVRYTKIHTDLHVECRGQRAMESALARLELDAPVSSSQAPIRPAAPPKSVRWLPWSIAGLALLLISGLIWKMADRRSGNSADDVAWLVNAQNCQWADGMAPEDSLRTGSVLRVDSGLAEIRFRSGARVILDGPAELVLLSGNSARLGRGKLTARVPESATGFEILSPEGKVIDLGTEFGISVAENGSTDVYVFEGKVEALPVVKGAAGANQTHGEKVSLTREQSVRMDKGTVQLQPAAPEKNKEYVRAIVPPPVIVPHVLTLNFRENLPKTMEDRNGVGTGLTHRLPGTGTDLNNRDSNLRVDLERGLLELTTTDSDINNQIKMKTGEYLGLRLADLGFTGKEDFEIIATIPHIPALRRVGQFGLYAGTKSNRNIRGGLISKDRGAYKQFFVNNREGKDTDSNFIGVSSEGDDLRLILKRIQGKFTLTAENLTTGSSCTLAIRHPEFLDPETDMYVGLFGANTQSNEPKTLFIKEIQVTVWTLRQSIPPK